MHWISALSLLSVVGSVALATAVITHDSRATLNRLLGLHLLLAAYWVFVLYGRSMAATTEIAEAWSRTGFLWPFSVATLAHFIIRFTGFSTQRTHRTILVILYATAAACSAIELFLIGGEELTPGAASWKRPYIPDPVDSVPEYIVTAWGGIVPFATLALVIGYWRRAPNRAERDQARVVGIGLTVAIALATFSDALVPYAFPTLLGGLPSFLSPGLIVSDLFIAYAITRHKLLRVSPTAAADQIVGSMFEAVILTDGAGGISFVNAATERMTGRSREELAELTIDDVLVGENGLPLAVTGDKLGTRIEAYVCSQKDSNVPVSVMATAIHTDSNQPAGFVYVCRDLTDVLARSAERVRRRSLESLSNIASGIAHDFNNIVMAISGTYQYLVSTIDESDPRKTHLDRIRVLCDRADRTVDALMHVTGQTLFRPEPVDLTAMLHALIPELERPSRRVSLSSPVDRLIIPGDEDQLQLVFEHLVNNAAEATREGGSIRIEVDNRPRSPVTSTDAESGTAEYIQVRVTDDGAGMDIETLSRVFEPYFTTHELGSHSGLGLAVVKGIVEQHGGYVRIHSRPHHGTTVALYFPTTGTR